jgi:hypothetical protein
VLVVIGLIVGLTAPRDAIALQLGDLAGAIAALDPSYEFSGLSYTGLCSSVGSTAKTAGSEFAATLDKGGTADASTLLRVIAAGQKGMP